MWIHSVFIVNSFRQRTPGVKKKLWGGSRFYSNESIKAAADASKTREPVRCSCLRCLLAALIPDSGRVARAASHIGAAGKEMRESRTRQGQL